MSNELDTALTGHRSSVNKAATGLRISWKTLHDIPCSRHWTTVPDIFLTGFEGAAANEQHSNTSFCFGFSDLFHGIGDRRSSGITKFSMHEKYDSAQRRSREIKTNRAESLSRRAHYDGKQKSGAKKSAEQQEHLRRRRRDGHELMEAFGMELFLWYEFLLGICIDMIYVCIGLAYELGGNGVR